MARRFLKVMLIFCVIASLTGEARAEREHDFGMALLKKFRFDDLAKKYFTKLRGDSDEQLALSGILGLAEITKGEALAASRRNSPKEAQQLYADALKLYETFVRKARNHPEMSTALGGVSEIKKKRAVSLKNAAEAETDGDKKRKLLREAQAVFASLTGPLKKEAQKAKERYEREKEKRGENKRVSSAESKALNTAVLAMQRHYMMLIDQASVFEKDSDALKKFLENLTKDLTRDLEYYEAMETMHGVYLWLNYTRGRAYALGGNFKEASQRGFDEVLSENPTGYPAAAKSFVDNLRMFSYYMKAQAALKAKKYDAAISTVDDMFMPPPRGYPQALSDARGNAAVLIKAEALIKREEPDYSRAIHECQRVINAAKMPWPNNARQLLAEINELAEDEAAVPAEIGMLHESALGMFQLALQERSVSARNKKLQAAIGLYENTLVACRGEDVTLRKRLEHEPTAWFELGICYSKIGLWYEAGFAFEAVLRYFAKDVVGADLKKLEELQEVWAQINADVKSGKIKAEEGQVVSREAILFDRAVELPQYKQLLTNVDTRLKKCANNIMVAARRRMRESDWNFDRDRYQQAILTLIQVDPAKRPLLDFHMAAARNTEADNLYRQKKRVEATKAWAEAADLFMQAADSQAAVRETGYHMAGKSFYRAMTEGAKLGGQAPGLAKAVPDFGKKALRAFRAFAQHIEATPAAFGENEKRAKRVAEAALARPVIYFALGDLQNTIQFSDEFLKSDERDEKFVPTVMWTRFKAICSLAADAVGTAGEAQALKRVENSANEFGKAAAYKKFYGPACSMVSATFTKALNKVNELMKTDGADVAALKGRGVKYRRASAEWMKKLIELDPEREKDLGFMASIAKVFYDQKAYDSARDLYGKVLKTHDPDGTGTKQTLDANAYELAAKKVVFDKEATTDAVRKSVRSLPELIFGEPEEERKRVAGKIRPPKKRNWQKGLQVCLKILKEHPKVQCADILKKTRDELSFRLQLLTVRLNLSDCTRALAKQIRDTDAERSKALWEEAIILLEKVREYWFRDNELRNLLAECYEALDRDEEALTLYAAVGRSAPDFSATQYIANVKFSRIALKKGDYRRAMKFPFMLTSGAYSAEQEWKQYFPDAQEFVLKCEEGIKNAGEEIGTVIDTGEDIAYDNLMSDRDEILNGELTAIKRRIEEGFTQEAEKEALQKNAFTLHFEQLVSNAINAPLAAVKAKRLKRSEVKGKQKMLLAPLLYQSPFSYKQFKELGVKLGFFEKPNDPIPMSFFSDKVKKRAIALALLNSDGGRKPIDEIDSDLLRAGYIRDTGEGETAPPETGDGAGGEGETTPEGGAAPPEGAEETTTDAAGEAAPAEGGAE